MSTQERELTKGFTGPILSDGTPIADLIDVENKVASLRLFSDPEVYRAEQQWLFGRSWNIVAHDTEIPNVGDFVMRHIAEDSIIVTRGREGEISVMLNVCTHRGMQVCRSEAGNANNFKCPYHGWVFGTEGNLLGAPFEREMYGSDLDKANLGLRQARVSVYAGIVFANWDQSAPPLEDFLGDYSFYLDTIFKKSKNGLECVGAPQRFLIQANWKTASEQFCGADGYHVATLHRSMAEGFLPGGTQAEVQALLRSIMFGVDCGSPQGHSARCTERRFGLQANPAHAAALDPNMPDLESLMIAPPEAFPAELVHELPTHLSPEQIHQLATFPPGAGGMFPNVGHLFTNLRVHVPVGVNEFAMLNWVLVEKDASPEFKATVRKNMVLQFGTSGTVEQDDSESWPSIQTSSKGYQGTKQSMKYQAFVGDNPLDDWKGGAYAYTGFSKDDSAWDWWMRYRQYMSGDPDLMARPR
ncbi:MAG: aromatic ring-hydroxylating dioxygenase subunit alpha [Ilumatobacteraceae bacterium]|nr:aromatic ring-hydroxylating dioxygenase subunit alpha [Ilumatobacteraceae bacterium]